MAASTFDTLAAADELRDAGFDERQARAIVSVLNRTHTTLATTTDREHMKAELAAAVEPLVTKAELARLTEQMAYLAGAFSMMKWPLGFIGVVTLAMAGRVFNIV